MSVENENSENPEKLFIDSSPNKKDKKDTPFDPNIYAVTKTVTKGLLNVALLTTNANQLKTTIENGPENYKFYALVITLSILSILLQTAMGILGVFVGSKNINYEHNHPKARTLNKTLLILGVITVIVNIILASFAK